MRSIQTDCHTAPHKWTITKKISKYTVKPETSDDVFIILFIFQFHETFRDKLLERFAEHIALTRTEEGCLLFDLYTIDGKDDTLVVYEHWRNESAVWDIHFKQPYSEVTGALLQEAIIGIMKQYMNFVTELT